MQIPRFVPSLALFSALAAAPLGCSHDTSDADATASDLAMGSRAWDAQAEKEWSTWIGGIGDARAANRCTSVNACIDDPTINPLKKTGDAKLDIFADCADLPMELRAYFAMKTQRPFKYMSDVVGDLPANHDPSAPPDYRYTANNHPVAWSTAKSASTLQGLLTRVSNTVHSGFFRIAAPIEDTDTYPIDIRPGTVHPGTVYYDPNGHVLVVYRVDPNGTVHMMDGHPDNSLTHTIFSDKIALGGANQGGGFRNFRPIDSQSLAYKPNAELDDFGTTQYGRGHAYYDWVRLQLSGGVALPPDQQFAQLLDQLCIDVQDRVAAVDAGKTLASGPIGPVPPNIYGADGDWEAFSTPGRDGKLRMSFRGITQQVNASVTAVKAGDPSVPWTGTAQTLVAAYQDIWDQHRTSCKVTYTSSAGAPVNLNLDDLQERLFQLSFDPYHCVEMRWGAYPDHGTEVAACANQDADHVQRFKDERRMRNAIDRPPAGTDTPFTWGPDSPEDVNVPALLRRLSGS